MPPPEMSADSDLFPAPVREVSVSQPLRWLAHGWQDFRSAPGPSLLHGLLAALVGYAIVAVAWERFYLLSGAFSGFLLVAPILATGLYALSRRLAAGEPATMDAVFAAWRVSHRSLVALGLLLMVLGTFWVGISAVMIGLFVQAPITGVESFVRHVVLSQTSNLFVVWTALGGVGAALVFAATVVSAPLLLDRDTDMLTAILTSVRAVGINPVTMALWAAIIMVLTLLGMLTLLLGLIVVIPVLGHASWHAYVDLVDASTLPPRR